MTVTEVMDRRDKLASGLRRQLACVWPSPRPTSTPAGWCCTSSTSRCGKLAPAAWPLAVKGAADLFRPAPFGKDQRGRAVTILLMFAGVLIGAMPGWARRWRCGCWCCRRPGRAR